MFYRISVCSSSFLSFKKKKRKKKKENARQARLKIWLLKFKRQSSRKWHERENSLENKLAQSRKSRKVVIVEKRNKNKRDRTTLTHDYSMLHSPGTNMDFYASRGSFLFLPFCIYKFFKHCFIKIGK